MFSDKKNKNTTEPSSIQNRINEGTHIVGDITSKGYFRIDGKLEGTITKPSRVVIGKNGSIEGKLICEAADIEGTFKGDLHVTGTLTLKETATIEGEIIIGKLVVEPGALLNAKCTMYTGSVPAAPEVKTNPYDRQNRTKKVTQDSLID